MQIGFWIASGVESKGDDDEMKNIAAAAVADAEVGDRLGSETLIIHKIRVKSLFMLRTTTPISTPIRTQKLKEH
ncbi:MAG: hypothetical protein WC457_02235 [Patescibacteria group bacterium]